jgi:hypothetical protein
MVEPYRLQHIVVSSVWTQVGVAVSSAAAIKELIGEVQPVLGQRSNQPVSGYHHRQGTILVLSPAYRKMVSMR